MIHTECVVACKQDLNAGNRVNLFKIYFPPHSFINWWTSYVYCSHARFWNSINCIVCYILLTTCKCVGLGGYFVVRYIFKVYQKKEMKVTWILYILKKIVRGIRLLPRFVLFCFSFLFCFVFFFFGFFLFCFFRLIKI